MVSIVFTMLIGLWGVFVKANMVKKIIALTVLGDSACLIFVMFGYRSGAEDFPKPPVVVHPYVESRELVTLTVDPVPQALVITAIVIELSLVILIAALSVRLYEHFGTLDLHKVLRFEELEAEEALEE